MNSDQFQLGAVAAAHPLAAQAGVRILQSGGNAFDAAVATAAALNVVEPFMSGICGMGVAVMQCAKTRTIEVLDFVPRAPAGFPPQGALRRADLLEQAKAVGVPGNLAGWAEILRTKGSQSMGQVLQPAIELAEAGFNMTPFGAAEVDAAAKGIAAKGPGFIERWLQNYGVDGKPPRAGSLLRQPGLARTFRAVARDGIGVLYNGPIGHRLVNLAVRFGSSLSLSDLQNFRPVWREPLSVRYRNATIYVPPPPSEAFQFVLGVKLLESFDLVSLARQPCEFLDLQMRALRIAAGERIRENLPSQDALHHLLSAAHLRSLGLQLSNGPAQEGPVEHAVEPDSTREEQHTTSFSVADRAGNAICITQSLGSPFGAGLVVPEDGLCMTNLLAWGDLHARGPKRLVPGGPLALPIAPSLTVSDSARLLLMGTPGSYGIPQTQAQVLIRHLDLGEPIETAIAAPRFRLFDGRKVLIEGRVPAAVTDQLVRLGHDVERGADLTRLVGGVHAVCFDPSTGHFDGGADPRRDGVALIALPRSR